MTARKHAYLLPVIFLLVAGVPPARCFSETIKWEETKSRHFIISHVDQSTFAREVSEAAEKHYSTIADSLGIQRFNDYWLWDKRAKIYLYPDRQAYLKATKAPRWSSGKADYASRTIYSYGNSSGFINGLLPHELTHLLFREFTKNEASVPLWIHEGIAQWHEKDKPPNNYELRILSDNGLLTPLNKLNQLDIRKSKSHNQARKFYAQSYSLTSYLIDEYGMEKFKALCRALRDGKKVEEALLFTYSTSFSSIEEFEQGWLESLKKDKK